MDLKELQALDRQARAAEIVIDGRRFTLVLPKQSQIEDATERYVERDDDDLRVPVNRVARALLLDAVTGWEGVTLSDLVEGCEAVEAPFSRGHLELLVDDGGALGSELRLRFGALVADRRKRVRELQKNSASA